MVLKKVEKMEVEELEDFLLDCMPAINFAIGEGRKHIYELESKIAGWHSHYGLYQTIDEANKMKEILGEPIFEGKHMSDIGINIDFFIKQYIWIFVAEDNEEAHVVLYLNEEGLSVEIGDECEDKVDETLEAIINLIFV